MIVESCPPGPVSHDDEEAEDEENEDVMDLVVSGSNEEAGLGDEETDPHRDIHISDDKQGVSWSKVCLPSDLCSLRLYSLV